MKLVKELCKNVMKKKFTIPDGDKDHGEDEVLAK
jgi:hypothetical protein